jgi:tRNA-dihydrouridine synthase
LLPRESFAWYLDVLRQQVTSSVERLDERRGILHIRRHLAATPLFKGIPNFRETRIAMLRTESVAELFDMFDRILQQYGDQF